MDYQELTQVMNYKMIIGAVQRLYPYKNGSCSSSYFDIYHMFYRYQLTSFLSSWVFSYN